MALPPAAAQHHTAQQSIVEDTAVLAEQAWRRVRVADLDASWAATSDLMFVAVAAGQEAAAAAADPYLDMVLAQTGQPSPVEGAVNVTAFTGVASDGRGLDELLYSPITAVKTAIGEGLTRDRAMRVGLNRLLRITATQVQDAGRTAVGTGIAARPRIAGYVRVLSLPSCSRCAVLAGRFYRWNAGFQRHPFCDCRHVPASEDSAGDMRTDPRKAIEAGQVQGLSEADTHAIVDDGADVAQVVNATKGMYVAAGRKLTSAGTSRRGLAGGRLAGGPRLRPEQIYREAGSRAETIELLRRNGYLI